MSQREAKQSEIAKRYGNVLFELAEEKGLLTKVLKDAKHVLECVHQDPQAWKFLSGPMLSLEVQTAVIEKLALSLKIDTLTSQFLKIVLQNHRLMHLGSMLEEFIACSRGAIGVLEGTLETAVSLPAQTIKKLQDALSKNLGKEVSLESYTKESLLGGVVLRVGSFMVDASLETRLNKLRERIKE